MQQLLSLMTIPENISALNKLYNAYIATELSYRCDLKYFRKGRTLSFDDILHYQRVIVALSETVRVMGEVDEIIKPIAK
jgi:hypothetical protein